MAADPVFQPCRRLSDKERGIGVKKFSFFYFIIMIAMWPAVDYLIGKGTYISVWFLLLLPLYICWVLFSPFLFYQITRKKQLTESFACCSSCQAEWCTLWFDRIQGDLAVLYMLYPFRVQHFSVKQIDEVRIHVDYNKKSPGYADQISCIITIDGKPHKISLSSRNRFYLVNMEGYGKIVLKEAEKFVNEIEETRRCYFEN